VHTRSATNVLRRWTLTGEAHQVAMLDEYFLALNQTTGKLRLSNLNDGATWDPTQFALRSAQSDPWVALAVNPPDIWLIGANTGDVWYDAGTSPVPARRANGSQHHLRHRSRPSRSWSRVDRCSGSRRIKTAPGLSSRLKGILAAPISSLELDTAIATYQRTSIITDAEAFVVPDGRAHLLRPAVPVRECATWLYDLTTDMWTEAGTWNSARGDYDVWQSAVSSLRLRGETHRRRESATGQLSYLDGSNLHAPKRMAR
jgi:hypothetical protein